MNRDYYAGMNQGRIEERESILTMLQTFLQLTQEPDDRGDTTDNPEWDHGFQAAMALIQSTRMSHDTACLISEGKWDAGCTCAKGIPTSVQKVK